MIRISYAIIILALFTMFTGCTSTKNLESTKANTYYNEATSTNSNINTESVNKIAISDVETKSNSESKQSPDSKPLKYNNAGIPVIMYHSVKYEKDNPVRISEENFAAQMKYLKDNNYTTLSLNELYEFIKNNAPVPEKSVVLTFDDGYKDNYENAYPILKKYGLKATIFVITDYIGKNEYLTISEIKELEENGIHIESHTVNHKDLSTLSYEDQITELKESKKSLEKLINREVKYIAYPYGKYNESTIKAAKSAGYELALTTDGKWSDKSDGIFSLDRVYISGFHSLDTFEYRITNSNYDFNKNADSPITKEY